MCLFFFCEATLQAVERYGTWYAIRGNLVDRELSDIEADSRWGRNGNGRSASRKERAQQYDWTRAFRDVTRSNARNIRVDGTGSARGVRDPNENEFG